MEQERGTAYLCRDLYHRRDLLPTLSLLRDSDIFPYLEEQPIKHKLWACKAVQCKLVEVTSHSRSPWPCWQLQDYLFTVSVP